MRIAHDGVRHCSACGRQHDALVAAIISDLLGSVAMLQHTLLEADSVRKAQGSE